MDDQSKEQLTKEELQSLIIKTEIANELNKSRRHVSLEFLDDIKNAPRIRDI